jgi:hypoxanthine-DNA glycosylase
VLSKKEQTQAAPSAPAVTAPVVAAPVAARDGAALTGLAPVVRDDTVLVVLGSFPGVASLAAQQYYAHPHNHFWRIIETIWPPPQREMVGWCYEKRIAWLLAQRVGLWDVYAACRREGSLDAAIRNAILNDFAALAARGPQIVAVAHNGGESFRHARRVLAAFPRPLESHRLPSTSPANASWSFERKLAAWRAMFARHGLV